MEATSTGSLSTKFTALGVTGAEIGVVNKLNDDGTKAAEYKQGTTAATGVFTYATATKLLSFVTAETPVSGEMYACAYSFKPTGSKRIAIKTDSIPSLALLTAYGLAKDICTGAYYPMEIEGKVQIDGAWKFDLSSDGDPAPQDLTMEFVKGCLSKTLYNFTVFTEEEA